MKTLRTLLLITVAVALLTLAALLAVSGHPWQAALLALATLAAVAAAAWADRNKPAAEPREWRVVDLPLPDELSEIERRMRRRYPSMIAGDSVAVGDPVDEDIEYGASGVELRGPYYDPTLIFADPVDEHAAQAIRAMSGQPAVLPELPLLLPTQPGCGRHRRDNR